MWSSVYVRNACLSVVCTANMCLINQSLNVVVVVDDDDAQWTSGQLSAAMLAGGNEVGGANVEVIN